MTTETEVLLRLLAWTQRRAVPTRSTYGLCPETMAPFSIALIRQVGEESLQAVACGMADGPPRIAITTNPLNRETRHLNMLATELDAYITSCIDAGVLPRVWLASDVALQCLELLGSRYQGNRFATPLIRRLGTLCTALAHEASYPGQQVVAVATRLLREHVVTGQSATQDTHLGALLAWVDPPPNMDVTDWADRQALEPAASMLDKAADDRVEALRGAARRSGRQGAAARSEIEAILRQAVLSEWERLVQARATYWDLGLDVSEGTAILAKLSLERFTFVTRTPFVPRSSVHALSRLLGEYEYLTSLVEALDVRYDSRVREFMRMQGRVFTGEIVDIGKPTPGTSSWIVRLRTRQAALRVREDMQLQTADSRVVGRVTGVLANYVSQETIINLSITSGMRTVKTLELGTQMDWADTVLFDRRALERRAYRQMRELRRPLVYGTPTPDSTPGLTADLNSAT